MDYKKETARNLENQKQRFKQEFIDLYVETRLPDLLNGIAAKIKQYLDCQEVSMFLYYSGKQELHFEVATGDKSQTLKTIILKKGTGIVGWVAEHLQSVITNNPATDHRFAATPDKKSLFNTRSLAAVPVESDGQLIGVLEAVNHKSDNFTPGHISLLEYIAQLIAIPLHNARLFHITQEEKEQKQQLVKLGSEIAASLEPKAILQTIKTFVTGIVTPTTFIIANYTLKRADDILTEKELPYEAAHISPISPSPHTFQSTLKANGKEIGFLKLQASTPIPPDAIPLLKGLANFTAIAINRHENLQELMEKQRYDKELQLARQIQKDFLPKEKNTNKLKKIRVAYTNIPSTKVSGDYYGVIPVSDHETIITINDISGHGIPAAQFMSLYSITFNYMIKKNNNILETLKHLHELFCQDTCNGHYVTSFVSRINSTQRTLTYINCGHTHPILIRGERTIMLCEGSRPIGFFDKDNLKLYTQPIESGDIIALFTDGITEAQNPKGHEYQSANLISCIKQHRDDPPQKILDACIDGLTTFTQKEKFNDDISLMIVKID